MIEFWLRNSALNSYVNLNGGRNRAENESQKGWKWIAECAHRLCKYIAVATEGANSELVDCIGFLGLDALSLVRVEACVCSFI